MTTEVTKSIEDASTDQLLMLWQTLESGEAEIADGANPEAWKGIIASVLNDRGELRGCGCATCSRIREYAIAWREYAFAWKKQTEEGQ